MPGEDRSSAHLAPPPHPPLPPEQATIKRLVTLGRRIADRTQREGLRPWSWGNGVAALGEYRFREAAADSPGDTLTDWYDTHARQGVRVGHVNDLAPVTAAVLLSGGSGRYLNLARTITEWALTHPAATRAPNGAMEHWPGGVWADTTFMAALPLGHLGSATGDGYLLTELGTQLVAHADTLQAPASGLFAHGSHAGKTIWCFWGRGNAWTALAAVEFLELVRTGNAVDTGLVDGCLVDRVTASLERQLHALAACQPDHGAWDVLVDGQEENAGIIESSATAGIGAAMLRAVPLLPGNVTDVRAAGWAAVRAALGYVDDSGVLTRTSAGTVLQLVPFGYSVIRDDRMQPWGQGLALHAVAAALQALHGGDAP